MSVGDFKAIVRENKFLIIYSIIFRLLKIFQIRKTLW